MLFVWRIYFSKYYSLWTSSCLVDVDRVINFITSPCAFLDLIQLLTTGRQNRPTTSDANSHYFAFLIIVLALMIANSDIYLWIRSLFTCALNQFVSICWSSDVTTCTISIIYLCTHSLMCTGTFLSAVVNKQWDKYYFRNESGWGFVMSCVTY